MIRASAVKLIDAVPEAHGIYEAPARDGKTVPCDVQSVTRREAYEALSHGLHPEWVLVLADWAEYGGQMTVEFEGHLYKVLRTYTRNDHRIELTVERMTVHDI